jgi:hypothetical protein
MNEDFLIEGTDNPHPLDLLSNHMRRVRPENVFRDHQFLDESSKNEEHDFNEIENTLRSQANQLYELHQSNIDRKSGKKLEGKAKSLSRDGDVYIVLY